jgi:multiple sugar transport system substrate-binding protein
MQRLLHGRAGCALTWCMAIRPSWSWTTSSASSSRSSAPTSPARLFHRPAARGACATPSASTSRYDIIAVDLPWIGEFADKGRADPPLDEVMDIDGSIRPISTPPAGARALGRRALWRAGQTTPELLFYPQGLVRRGRLEPPATTDDVLARRHFHDPRGRYGVAWNAARGTALGHTFMMTCADFGQPISTCRKAGGFDGRPSRPRYLRPMLDTDRALAAAEYLMELLQYSPPDILSMSWYERVRPYAAGKVAMAYGYTCWRPISSSTKLARHGRPAICRIRTGRMRAGRAGGRLCAGHSGQPRRGTHRRRRRGADRLHLARSAEALCPERQPHQSPRYSVGADPEVRRLSPIFEAVDQMSWRDELQFWPRPPIPQISGHHRDLRRRIARHAARHRDAARGAATAQAGPRNAENPVH